MTDKTNARAHWRFLVDSPRPAALNMADDEAISIAFLNGKVPPTLRLYRWSFPSISIGSFQKWEPEWDTLFKEGSIRFVRRITGGRALLHDRELTYSIVGSTRDPLFSEGIKGTFYTIAEGLLTGLKSLGVDTNIYAPPRKERQDHFRNPLCFASTSWYEITARGKKLIGSAQRRWVTHFLQHGSLIIETRGIQGFPPSENQIGMVELLPQLPTQEKLEKAIQEGFESALSIRLEPGVLTAEERKIANRLVEKKYGTPAWTLRRDFES